MLKVCTVVILLAAFGLPSLGQGAPAKADSSPTVEVDIKNLELDLAKLLVKEDWDHYAAHLADDYVRTTTTGEVQNKASVMADLHSGKNKLLDSIPEDLQVHIYGDTAILTGHLTDLMRQNGRVTTVLSRFTSVFVKQNGNWLLAAQERTQVFK